jgi:4-alpha-glucanotransferase
VGAAAAADIVGVCVEDRIVVRLAVLGEGLDDGRVRIGPISVSLAEPVGAGPVRVAVRPSAWQVLPLGPTGYGDSPYQCFSAFAGNPLLVSLDRLIDDGLLTAADAAAGLSPPTNTVDFPAVIAHRESLWPLVLERFDASAVSPMHERFERFRLSQANWLNDYALFMAVKSAHGQKPWTLWARDIAHREPDAIARWTERCVNTN